MLELTEYMLHRHKVDEIFSTWAISGGGIPSDPSNKFLSHWKGLCG